jgi:hypothetical protein
MTADEYRERITAAADRMIKASQEWSAIGEKVAASDLSDVEKYGLAVYMMIEAKRIARSDA